MIRITGTHKQELLDALSRKRKVDGGKEVIHNYTHMFACKAAVLREDALVINTHSENLDSKVLLKTATIMNLDATVEVV